MAENNILSDELLAAYLDGNVSEAEAMQVLGALGADSELQEVLDIALDVDIQQSFDILPMMSMAAESGSNICSVLCEAFVLHHRAIPYEERNLLSLAQNNQWLTPNGSPLHAIGRILSHYGLMVTRKYNAAMDDIVHALSLDNDVLVVVDVDKLYADRCDKDDIPNHAVVLTAIDLVSDKVTIFDPQENSKVSIPVSDFEQAWNVSHNYMVCVLQSIDDYEPQPINLEHVELTEDLLELQEAIAENAHEVWAAARKKEGWTYGKERDDENKKHPDLIPYSSLPEGEKEYDRLMAFDTIRLVKKLGFEIVKKRE